VYDARQKKLDFRAMGVYFMPINEKIPVAAAPGRKADGRAKETGHS
jgi:hypothetical protein